jgi:hypothetical protein
LFAFTGPISSDRQSKKEYPKMTDFYEDACYLSTSEPEPDSEVEELDDDVNHDSRRSNGKAATKGSSAPSSEPLQWEDPQALLNTWLGELDSLKVVSGSISWLSLLVFSCPARPGF